MNNGSELIERIKEGDRAAFNQLYKQYYFSLRSYARLLLKEEEEAEDVIQDVFFNLWVRRESLNPSLSIQGYLLRSVYNTAINSLKRKNLLEKYSNTYKQKIEEIGIQHYYNPDTNDTIANLYAKELHAELNHAIESLPPRCKEVFSLSFLHELSGKEISSKLGVSLSTVENHINNALKILRKRLIHQKNEILLLYLLLELL